MAWHILSCERYLEQQKDSDLNFVNAKWLVSLGQDWRSFHLLLLQEGNKQINVCLSCRYRILGPILRIECVKG